MVNPKDRWPKEQKQELGVQLIGGVPAFKARALPLTTPPAPSLGESKQGHPDPHGGDVTRKYGRRAYVKIP